MASFPSLSPVLSLKSDANLKSAASKANVAPVDVCLTTRKLLTGHFSKISGVAWAADGSLVSAGQDGKLIQWNAVTGTKLGLATLQCDYVMAIDCCQDDTQLTALGGMDNHITFYHDSAFKLPSDASSPTKPHLTLQGHTGYISSINFFDRGKLFSTSGDSSAVVWDIERSSASHVFKGVTGQGMSCGAPQPETSSMFVSCEVDGHIHLWDSRAASAPVIVFQQAPSSSSDAAAAALDVNAISFLPGGAFVTAHDDELCRVWDLRSSCIVGQLPKETTPCGPATAMCLSKSGRLAFVGYADGTVKVWDVLLQGVSTTFEPVKNRESHAAMSHTTSTRQRISSLKLSPDGFGVACSSWDKTLRIFA